MGGIGNLFKLTKDHQEIILDFDIICLLETFKCDENFRLPHFMNKFSHVYSLAEKEAGTVGRGSGGISIFFKDNLNFEFKVILITVTHIIIDFIFKFDKLRIVILYYRPQPIYNDLYLEIMTTILQELTLIKQENYKILCMGDFNARIGQLNNIYEKYIFEDSKLLETRSSSDLIVNIRGQRLVKLMEDMGYLVLNGRSIDDCPASFTYSSSKGKSAIDLAWVTFNSINLIDQFEVIDFSIYSNHMLCKIKMSHLLPTNVTLNRETVELTQRIKWDPERDMQYVNALSSYLSIFRENDNPEILAKYLISNINNSLRDAEMMKIQKPSVYVTYNSPWFDKQCMEAKKAIKQSFRILKKNKYDDESYAHYIWCKKNIKA